MKKWIIRILLLQVALIGVVAALPVVLPIWEEYRPRPVVRVDAAMRRQAIESLLAQTSEHYVFPEKAKPIEALNGTVVGLGRDPDNYVIELLAR